MGAKDGECFKKRKVSAMTKALERQGKMKSVKIYRIWP